jgi:nitroreductase
MDLIEGIKTRRSFRAFKPTPIPEKTLKDILETAARSPSFTNTQPWEVAVVTGKKKTELSKILYQLADSGTPIVPDMPFPKVWPPDLEKRSKDHNIRRMNALGIQREDEAGRKHLRMLNYEFYGAPCVLFLFLDKTLTPWSIFDMGLFAQSIILAAHAFGVESCLQAAITQYPDAARDFLGIPKTKQLLLGISMGYPDNDAKLNSYHSTRSALDEFVKWHV